MRAFDPAQFGDGVGETHQDEVAALGGVEAQIVVLRRDGVEQGAFVILSLPKGRGLHKPLGWLWVTAMGVTAVSSLFMTGLNGNFYSLIHLLTGWTLIALPMGVFAIRNRNVLAHRRAMTGMFLGGLIVAGAFAFLPGRFMFELFF